MTRIVDYAPSDEQGLVGRILLAVHKAADEAFPSGREAVQRQFAKTVVAATGTAAKAAQSKPPLPAPLSQARPLSQHRPISQQRALSQPAKSIFSKHGKIFTSAPDESDIDYLISEKQKSRKLVFFVIALATAAFIALTLLITSRNFG